MGSGDWRTDRPQADCVAEAGAGCFAQIRPAVSASLRSLALVSGTLSFSLVVFGSVYDPDHTRNGTGRRISGTNTKPVRLSSVLR